MQIYTDNDGFIELQQEVRAELAIRGCRYAASLIDFGVAPLSARRAFDALYRFHIDLHRLTCLRIHSDLGYS